MVAVWLAYTMYLPVACYTCVLVGKWEPLRVVAAVVVVVVVETWRLGSLEKGFSSKRLHAAQVGGKKRERWGWFAK